MSEKKSATTRFTLDATKPSASEQRALNQRLKHADAHPLSYGDSPELSDEWFLRAAMDASLRAPPAKKPISMKLDADVLDYFKSEGGRYQTHMNAVLRAYMQARRLARGVA